VYRKLGQMLIRGKAPDLSIGDNSADPIRTRFMIDILSGTSAGGINAVFLAKALANDQNITKLKQLWVEKGDIGVLLNDNLGESDVNLGKQDPPRSVLDSRRMYYELLDALEGMDRESIKKPTGSDTPPGPFNSPYVEELDLFTTATDIHGRVIRLSLADRIVTERLHRNSFHFRYSTARATGKEQNDFTAKYNPFLAFAARCTSAHPAPFEPMTLSEIDDTIETYEAYRQAEPLRRAEDDLWQSFYEQYLQPAREDSKGPSAHDGVPAPEVRKRLVKKFLNRPFSDGGVLDNSPFSFAIDKLQFRHSSLPVDRKLIYIEPVPQHPEELSATTPKPDAFKNALLSLSTIPSYQTIREDLERLLARNLLVERVGHIIVGIEKDELERVRKKNARREEKKTANAERLADLEREDRLDRPLTAIEFGAMDIRIMIDRMGSAWGGYQRLRVAEASDEMALIISRAAGFDEDSAELQAIRQLVRTWRRQNYSAYGLGKKGELDDDSTYAGADKKSTENAFLFQHDMKWRLRRLKFALKKADEISCFDKHAKEILGFTENSASDYQLFCDKADDERAQSEKEFRQIIRDIKGRLSEVLKFIYVERGKLLLLFKNHSSASEETNPLTASIAKLKITPDALLSIVEPFNATDREKKSVEILKEKKDAFDDFLKDLQPKLRGILKAAGEKVLDKNDAQEKGILALPASPPSPLTPEYIACATLRYYYDNFDRYDMISYPILYATNVGEEPDVVDVFRISPEDVTSLVRGKEKQRRKLAGTSIGNFGAFFDRRFRVNDILWGRLDCAERIITAMLATASPTPELESKRLELIREAHDSIIAEELKSADKEVLREMLGSAIAGLKTEEEKKKFRDELSSVMKSSRVDPLAQRYVLGCLEDAKPLENFDSNYEPDHALSPAVLVRSAARASKIMGKMLEGIAEQNRIDKKRVVWITRLAQLFWGLVEVAVPGSVPNLIFYHWRKLLYLFEFLLVLFGTILVKPRVQEFGLLTFAITVAVHGAVLLLGDLMAGKSWWRNVIKAFLVALVLMSALLSIIFLTALLGANSWLRRLADFKETFKALPSNQLNAKTLIYAGLIAVVGLFFFASISRDLREWVGSSVRYWKRKAARMSE
jgi:patatin-related protein